MIPKFRVWDTFDEEMLSDIYFTWADCGYESLNKCLADSRWIFMQSTGFFDKRGNEIFEGDVVEVCGENSQKVFFSYGAFCIDFLTNGTPLHAFGQNQLEVIGNIYEHSYLVEVE